MRSPALALIVLVSVCVALPRPMQGAEADTQWRQRASAVSDEVTRDDVSEEIRFGREIAARLIGRFGHLENAPLTKYVNLVGHSLSFNANRPEIEFHFAVLNTDEINAYAAPGGYVFVTKGALAKMQDEAELAAVLAHEVTHISERHVVKELNIHGTEGSAAAGLARIIGGGTEAARVTFFQIVDKALDILIKDGYRREDETQADGGAVMLCAVTGYDPSALVRYFDRISIAKGSQTEILDKTHPAYAARIAGLKQALSAEGIDAGSFKANKQRFTDSVKSLK
jgi:predicted Zn-dependent protease